MRDYVYGRPDGVTIDVPPESRIYYSSLSWSGKDKSLYVLQPYCFLPYYENNSFITSFEPRIYTKVGEELSLTKVSKLTPVLARGPGPNMSMLHRLLPGDNQQALPDIVWSLGPSGSGSYVYVSQLHYIPDKGTWAEVWHHSFPEVLNATYDEGRLIVTCSYGVQEPLTIHDVELQWGGDPSHYEIRQEAKRSF